MERFNLIERKERKCGEGDRGEEREGELKVSLIPLFKEGPLNIFVV